MARHSFHRTRVNNGTIVCMPPRVLRVSFLCSLSVPTTRMENGAVLNFNCVRAGFHMTPRLSKIFPESCLLIVVGVVVGVLLFQASSVHVSPLTPDTFFLYMLPPIILDAGYFMPNRLFFDHLGTILLFAVVGTIFNTLSIGW